MDSYQPDMAEAAVGTNRHHDGRRSSHPYPTRGTSSSSLHSHTRSSDSHRPVSRSQTAASKDKPQKHVTFQHILPDPRQCARLPMRVMISPHDTTDSIIATVKNFYGLYSPGVSFQDCHGNILIAAYDNFENDMNVYVKETAPEARPPLPPPAESATTSPEKPKLGAPFEMRPPASRLTLQTDSIDRPSTRQRTDVDGDDASDSECDAQSATSRRSKAEAHVRAEISVDNIVEGGRRKRAKFESFELPLFVPPQVAAGSISSISPQRRAPGFDYTASPMPFSNKKTFVYGQPVPSPQSYGRVDGYLPNNGYTYGQQIGGRGAPVNYHAPRRSTGGILPTPEPTIGSVISDEDVALQLMRLGDSVSHGRTSTSTADDNFSRGADVHSSDEDVDRRHRHSAAGAGHRTSGAQPVVHQEYGYSSDVEYDYDSAKEEDRPMHQSQHQHHQHQAQQPQQQLPGPRKLYASKKSTYRPLPSDSGTASVNGSAPAFGGKTQIKGPMSPASIEPQSRRMSMASTGMPVGEDGAPDLSCLPRCQRCRKSKKGCDRQRPCGRCKDAGLGLKDCIPEEEGNGRKGRYGRPMNPATKKEAHVHTGADCCAPAAVVSAPSMGITGGMAGGMLARPAGEYLTPALPLGVSDGDKSKKRKR